MKRFAIVLTAVGAVALLGAQSASAHDNRFGTGELTQRALHTADDGRFVQTAHAGRHGGHVPAQTVSHRRGWPGYGRPRHPGFGRPIYGRPVYGGPVWGGPVYGHPGWGGVHPGFGGPVIVQPAPGIGFSGRNFGIWIGR